MSLDQTQRWAFVRGAAVRLSRVGAAIPSDEQTRHWLYGEEPPEDTPPLAEEGAWLPCPDATGETWCFDGNVFLPPVDDAPRLVNGAEFLSLFTPAEVAAMWGSGPEFMVAALRIAAQNVVNLDSVDLRKLLGLAVARKALDAARLPRITQGLPPGLAPA